jgi:hypothetical protein
MKAQSITILFLIVLFSFLVSGCSIIGTLEKTGCKLLPDGNTKDHCWQDAAVRLSMPSICYFIQGYKFGVVDNSPPMTKCFLRIAEKEKDPTICEKIVEGHPNGYTKIDCYLATAVAAKNTAFCDLIDKNESRGFGMFLTSREQCYLDAGSRPKYCSGESDMAKCLSAAAINMLDVTICEDGTTPTIKQMCLLNAIEGMQNRLTGNSNLSWNSAQCAKLNDPNLKYSCSILAVAAFQQNSACDNILETQYNELCRLMVQFQKTLPEKYSDAEKQKAINECAKFSIGQFKGFCLFSFGHELELTASNEGPGNDRDRMETDAIEMYLQGCELMGAKDDTIGPEAGFICILLPGNLLEPRHCPTYNDLKIKDLCYELAAMQTGDCSKIQEAETKSDCKDGILTYYKAQEKICAKLKNDAGKYRECQKDYAEGNFMQQLGVKMPDTMKKFMSGK